MRKYLILSLTLTFSKSTDSDSVLVIMLKSVAGSISSSLTLTCHCLLLWYLILGSARAHIISIPKSSQNKVTSFSVAICMNKTKILCGQFNTCSVKLADILTRTVKLSAKNLHFIFHRINHLPAIIDLSLFFH